MGVPVSIDTAKSLTKASKDLFLRRFVPDEVEKVRIEACRACPSWSKQTNRCTECGCQMKVKAKLTSSECPLKKWGRYVPTLDFGDTRIDASEHEKSTK